MGEIVKNQDQSLEYDIELLMHALQKNKQWGLATLFRKIKEKLQDIFEELHESQRTLSELKADVAILEDDASDNELKISAIAETLESVGMAPDFSTIYKEDEEPDTADIPPKSWKEYKEEIAEKTDSKSCDIHAEAFCYNCKHVDFSETSNNSVILKCKNVKSILYSTRVSSFTFCIHHELAKDVKTPLRLLAKNTRVLWEEDDVKEVKTKVTIMGIDLTSGESKCWD